MQATQGLTRAHVQNPSSPNPLPSLTFVRPRDQLLTACVSGPGLYSRKRARGGLVRGTARTTRARPCRPGTVPIETTAATRHLSRHSRSLHLHSPLAHLRATTPRLHSITHTLTPGDVAACSRMPTAISLTHSDLTHAVFLTLRVPSGCQKKCGIFCGKMWDFKI